MKVLLIAISFVCASLAHANLQQAPTNLNIEDNQGVFVDFISAKTVLTYDVKSKSATAQTIIEFNQTVEGHTIFDLVPEIESIRLNGKKVDSKKTTMNGVSSVRYIDDVVGVGTHKLEITNEITTNLSFSGEIVKSAFWMSDLSDRRYIEQYLPTNLEYDQYQTQLEVVILNSQQEHKLYTNGEVQELALNHWSVAYPSTFTASSYFLHLTPVGAIPELKSLYQSVDGRKIPVTVYSHQSTTRFMNATLEILAELERDYGPWPHAQVIIYGAGSGGMEHCGATITSFGALGHELTHSYFARGVMPAHGNSGWVDEAIASWRDAGYPSYAARNLSRTRMAAHSEYARTTDRNAYTKGMRFIGYLHGRFQGQESFKIFLRNFFETFKFKPFKTEQFKQAIAEYYNTDITQDFDTYIYGKNGVDSKSQEMAEENPFHPKLSAQQLLDLL